MAEAQTQTNGNGGSTGEGGKATKEDSILTKLHADWKKRTNGKKPDAKVIKEHKGKLQAALDKMNKAEAMLKEGQKEFEEATAPAMEAFGRTNLAMEHGVLLEPSCRGDRLYYKRRSNEDAL